MLGYIRNTTLVLIIIIVIMVCTNIKETIPFQVYYLVNLKI